MFLTYCVTLIFTFFYISAEAFAPNENFEIDLEDATIQAMITGMEKFTNNLMTKLYTDVDLVGNIIFSPISVYAVLALLLFGSKDTTYETLAEALGLPIQTDLQQLQNSLGIILQAFEVSRTEMIESKEIIYEEVILGQSLYIHQQYSLLNSYRDFLKIIAAQDFVVDFENDPNGVMVTINDWISRNTGKRVTVAVSSPFPKTSKVLVVSAVFFSAQWENNLFQEENSGKGTFQTTVGLRDIQTMTTTEQLFYYESSSALYSAVQLSYKGGDYRMVIVLPQMDVNAQEFATKFTMNEYKNIIDQSQIVKVRCTIPKIMGVFASTLRKYLQDMGMSQLFEGCNLGNMIQNLNGNIKVHEVLHATAMDINEAGTTASITSMTSTNADIFEASLMQVEEDTPISFLVNRPFLMFIHHEKTNLPLYTTFIREL